MSVRGVTAVDLKLSEDGKTQTITSLANAGPLPWSIALLVDNSGSTVDSGSHIKAGLVASVQLFRSILTPGRDKFALFALGTSPTLRLDFTDNFDQLVAELNTTLSQPFGGTALHDNLVFASTHLSRRQGRRLIVLISDGDDNRSNKSLDEALKPLREDGTAVIGIFTPGARPLSPGVVMRLGRESIETIAAETGGWFYDSGDLRQFEKSVTI